MTHHTDTYTRTWDNITRWSITAFALGVIGQIIAGLSDTLEILEITFMLLTIAGLVMSYVGGVKSFGGLQTGIASLIIGLVLFLAGTALLDQVDSSTFLGVEIPEFSSPEFVIGYRLNNYGLWLLIVGGIMTVVTYLYRVLKAVERKPR